VPGRASSWILTILVPLVVQTSQLLAEAHRLPRLDADCQVDGVLDEAAWDRALSLPLGIEVEPAENVPAPVQTEVRLYYSETQLCAGFLARDPNPAAIRSRLSDRDSIDEDDWVGLVLDTFNDARRSFIFRVNPLGVQADSIETTDGEGGSAWDAIWSSAGRTTPEGYVVEMAIPFSSLRFQRTDGEQVWGFDAIRSYPRGVRHQIGLFERDRSNNCYLCQADKITGISGVEPSLSLELDPTVSALYAQRREPGGSFETTDSDPEAGLTARWSVTPNLTLAGAINPDFSQVETDAAQLDVNRQFALFYPEKRPFFLEGSDFFETPLNAVYTRTVADPSWGVKLTGKVGRGVIGVFTARDEVTNLLIPAPQSSQVDSIAQENQSTAVRYRRDLGRSSTIGVLVTDREGERYHNRVGGLDLSLRPTPTHQLRLQVLGSSTRYPGEVQENAGQPAGTLEGSAIDLFYSHQTRDYEAYFMFRDVEPGFRSDLGFTPQAGFRHYDTGYVHHWQHDDPGHWYNSVRAWIGYEYDDDREGNMLRQVAGSFVLWQGPRQSSLYALLYRGKRTYLGREYGNDTLQIDSSTTPVSWLSLGLSGFVGDDVDLAGQRPADRLRLTPSVTLRAGERFQLSLSHDWERLDIAAGRLFRASLSELRTAYQINLRSFVRLIVQNVDYRFDPELYEGQIDAHLRHLLTQLLFSYKINPQTALYLGYSDNYDANQAQPLTQVDRSVFVKLGYAWLL